MAAEKSCKYSCFSCTSHRARQHCDRRETINNSSFVHRHQANVGYAPWAQYQHRLDSKKAAGRQHFPADGEVQAQHVHSHIRAQTQRRDGMTTVAFLPHYEAAAAAVSYDGSSERSAKRFANSLRCGSYHTAEVVTNRQRRLRFPSQAATLAQRIF
eukprot:5120314-Amphidinium_carterae.1